MSHLAKIFACWDDNAEAMAADLGEKGVTVRAWRTRGDIHSDHWPKIIRAAAARGCELHPTDFWPADVVAGLPRHAAAPSAALIGGSSTKAANNFRDNIGDVLVADNPAQNIRDADGQGADSHRPFSDSPSTCSTTRAPSAPSSNPVCSTGGADA